VADDRALPAHYRDVEKRDQDEDARPTPGVTATECADPHVRADMQAVAEHKRRRARRRR